MNYIKIWKEVTLTPSDFYSKMPPTGGYTEPLTFATINYLITGFLCAFIIALDPEVMDIYNDLEFDAFSISFALVLTLLFSIFMLIAGIISTFFSAAIYDVIYKLLGGTGNYRDTVRFLSYATSTLVPSFIPLIGWIFSLYGIYLYIVGGMFVHKVSMGKSAIAVFLPILVFFLMGVIGSLEG